MFLEGSLTDISNPSKEPIQVMSQLGTMTLLATGFFFCLFVWLLVFVFVVVLTYSTSITSSCGMGLKFNRNVVGLVRA